METSIISGTYFQSKDHLDLSELLQLLSGHFHFTQNKNIIKNSPERKSFEEIDLCYFHQDQVREVENWEQFSRDGLNAVHGDFPFAKSLEKLKRYQVLEDREVLNTYYAVTGYTRLTKYFQLKGHTTHPRQTIDSQFKQVKKEVPLVFDEKTQSIVYYRHPVLSPIDRKIKETTKLIREKLIHITSEWSKREILQTDTHDKVDERYLLPVRSDRYTPNLGKIVYRSNSGNTLFVEPSQLRDLANTKSELEGQLEREVHKILLSISNHFSDQVDILSEIFDFYLELDLACGRLNASYALGFQKPDLYRSTAKFTLKDIYHPLISNPVKNDFSLPKKSLGLLISGPNTGGKTVLLKSLALTLLLPHLGFHIPAKHADIPLCNDIHFLSHDNQDLKEGLSSFSSEAIVYLNLFKNIKKGDAVFIDEIFNSTSSLEASELATAIIKELKDRGVLVFISSHHENLKEWVFSQNLLESAHMGFKDSESTPTYILHLGTPGKSYAKEVFKTLERKVLGSKLISQRIEQPQKPLVLDEQISTLEKIENEKRESYEDVIRLKEEIIKEKESIKGLLELEKIRLQEEFDSKWDKLKRKTLDEAEKARKGSNVNNLARKLGNLKPQKTQAQQKAEQVALSPVTKVEVGQKVHIKGLNKDGVVIALSNGGKKVQLNCGGLKLWQPLHQLSAGPQHQHKPKKTEEKVRVSVSKMESSRNLSFDARGMRRDEFLLQAELHVLDVINGDLPFVDIIHGHGDGILKSSLYKLLARFKDEIHFDFVEGNQGTTRVELLN